MLLKQAARRPLALPNSDQYTAAHFIDTAFRNRIMDALEYRASQPSRLRGAGGDGGSTGAESRSSYLEMYKEKKEEKVALPSMLSLSPSRLGDLFSSTRTLGPIVLTRRFAQQNFGNAQPLLANCSLTAEAHIEFDSTSTCTSSCREPYAGPRRWCQTAFPGVSQTSAMLIPKACVLAGGSIPAAACSMDTLRLQWQTSQGTHRRRPPRQLVQQSRSP